MSSRFLLPLALVSLTLLGGAPGSAEPPDPVSIYPENYKVLFENDRVRVLDFRLARGASEVAPRHPANVAVRRLPGSTP